MTAPALSLWEAYQVETLRSKGLDNDTLLQALKEKDLKTLTATDDSFDYQDLIDAADENTAEIQTAILSGYTIKYLSIYGIKNLLKLKYDLEAGKDYAMSDTRFDDLKLNENQFRELQTLASSQWQVIKQHDDNGKKSFAIRHHADIKE